MRKLHLIGNAHIDPVWLWQWREGFHEVKATFRSALDRMREYDDFIFTASSAAFYEWVEQSDPEMFAEIQQRVAEGRWALVGGWWVEPDCNIPGGESLVRQGLYAQRYFAEKFGRIATVGFNVDSFGHAASLPQLLLKSGITSYCFLRPNPQEKGLPGRLFWWETQDGSCVLAFRIAFEYGTGPADVEAHARRCAAEMKPPMDELMCFYGVGNHGGGPTIANIEQIRQMEACRAAGGDPDLPALVFSSPDAFFAAARAAAAEGRWALPVVRDEMQNHASGCYAAHSGIKRWNRLAEHRLMTAEKWAALAEWATGQPYPADLAAAWKSLLFNQFHDTLAGTSIEPAYDDARDQIGEALAIADRGFNLAAQAFAWRINIPLEPKARPLVVFNPHAWAGEQVVEMEFGRIGADDVLLNDAGNVVPHQLVQSRATAGRNRLCFLADLPALGYRTYRVVPAAAAAQDDAPAVEATDTLLDNGHFRLTFDERTGAISSLRDLDADIEVFAGPAAVPMVLDDPTDTWGHNTFRWDRTVGSFHPECVQLVERGPVRWTVRVTSRFGASLLRQDFSLYAANGKERGIDVAVTVDWREPQKMLKLRFPVNLKFMKVTSEAPYGYVERKAYGDEEPIQSWLDMSGTSRDREICYGFALLNDGKYSADVNVRDIGLTVLRNPVYAHHIPAALQPDAAYTFVDHGIQRFNYTMLPHRDSWENARVSQAAAELNQRPFAMLATFHPQGTLPQADGFIEVAPSNVIVSVVKKAEDGGALILRAYETTGARTDATIRLPKWDRTIDATFAPGELKTFRVPADRSAAVTEVNLLEWDAAGPGAA